MPYTTARIGPNRWGLYHDGRLLATVMTQKDALRILEQLRRSNRLHQVEAGVSGMVPLKRSKRGRQKGTIISLSMASGSQS
ncbi:MAG: hypothetical protein HC860_22330 [Alkalinema sp. RU_4_3]|nr:hypothetical protein [Alkalinema sp. RU_4_3]